MISLLFVGDVNAPLWLIGRKIAGNQHAINIIEVKSLMWLSGVYCTTDVPDSVVDSPHTHISFY